MSKLTKAQAKAHQAACDLLSKDVLSIDERLFVIENWQESAKHINTIAGAFFTPWGLARDFSIEVCGRRVIDLCAGIGSLSLAYLLKCQRQPEITCIEKNPDYLAVGRKVLPEATWIEADVFDVPDLGLGHFQCAYGNPPFGATPRNSKKSIGYSGSEFEYHVINIASKLAEYGTFIVPQNSAPFTYSGKPVYTETNPERYKEFSKQTGIELGANCGIDTSVHAKDWHGVSVAVEIVTSEFKEPQVEPIDQLDMFAEAAE